MTARCLVVVALAGCGGGDGGPTLIDASVDAAQSECDPVAQTGCEAGNKCTWIKSGTPHLGCAPSGAASIGRVCKRDAANGTDDCVAGGICSATGVCASICDPTAGCLTTANCVVEQTTIAEPYGFCQYTCDPLADNDFDGYAPVLSKTGTGCGSDVNRGCYGSPSRGTPPVTSFECVWGPGGYFHRTFPQTGNGVLYLNSCSPGYLPLLIERTGSSTAICVAMCKPANCYAGNCGTNDENHLGLAPHRCNDIDRRGTFDTSPGAEHCQFAWPYEVDAATMTFLKSVFSDTLGFCYDHSKYLYDSDGDNMRDSPTPRCADLQDGFGSGTNPADPLTYFGAADLGCVDSSRLMPFAGKQLPRLPRGFDGVRPLWH